MNPIKSPKALNRLNIFGTKTQEHQKTFEQSAQDEIGSVLRFETRKHINTFDKNSGKFSIEFMFHHDLDDNHWTKCYSPDQSGNSRLIIFQFSFYALNILAAVK